MMIRRWVALAVAVASTAGAGVTAAYGDSAAPPPAPEQVLGELAPGASDAESAPEPSLRPRPLPASEGRQAPQPGAVSAQPGPGAPEFPPSWQFPEAGQELPAEANVFRGKAFDTCHAPSMGVLRNWRASDYRAVGVYFGGRGRACPNQPNLTPEYLTEGDRIGWNFLPIYVGSQSPCVIASNKQNVRITGDPVERGAAEGADAVDRAAALGMERGSALYLDMEAYDHRKADCAATTLAFVRAWNRAVTDSGYVPGFYSSASSGITHLESERRAGTSDLPAAIWFARWQQQPDLWGEPVLDREAWAPDARIHQYAGNVTETHGGSTLTIDRNQVSAPVARIG
ncbi:peptidoglycan-binding protein [Streptomyces sp. 604F]|uniref:DUF1906 domain-containing protein n=1 Tax=Streptomyces sp. 604F TaxID=1476754 RepID=UPI001397121E|nr:DUF1906 domain-containing protein [Streptomyces sp. 604F]MBP3078561.1 peptidoglycan-binding protein [Streptomyces sp. 604F]QHV86340.1 peptidoglycan-binding protein [Streptomyces sp. 604F]